MVYELSGEQVSSLRAGEAGRSDEAASGLTEFVQEQLIAGRDELGTGGNVDRRPMFRLLKEGNISAYPLFALLMISVGDTLAATAGVVLSPDIARTFGLTPQFFTLLALVGQVVSFAIPLAVARFVQNHPRRAMVLLASQGLWCLVSGFQGLVVAVGALMVLSILDGATSAAKGTVSDPLLIDLYPPAVRVRVVSFLAAAAMATSLIATSIVALLTGPLGLSWRSVYLVTAAFAILTVLFALGLRDPGYGAHDTEKVRRLARRTLIERDGAPVPMGDSKLIEATRLSIPESLRRIWMIHSMRFLLLAGMIAALQLPALIYLQFFFANRFSIDASGRALLTLVGSVVGLLSYVLLAPYGDRLFQRSPKLMFWVAAALGILGTLLSMAQLFVYSIGALVVLNVLGSAFVGLTGPALVVGTMSIVPASLRPHTGALSGMFSLIGAAAGTALLGGLTGTLGIPITITITLSIGIASQIMVMVAGLFVRKDLDAVIEEVIENEYVSHATTTGAPFPMLSVRNLEYYYGQTQVLFGVDIHVNEGEIVALMGVNGAGKSSLLRAICGLGASANGSVRLQGHDITYLDAERRTRLGIVHIPGGRAVFRDLTVHENLRLFAYGLPIGERHLTNSRIGDALNAFPQLVSKLQLPAGNLSGGEQQMLALAKAFVLRPKLLMIDELSLGLAPNVVGDLLEVVREINARGTAVILVEQSVNVALAIAGRAYFMERGCVRFDGPTEQLREDSSMLRSVFLAGARGANR